MKRRWLWLIFAAIAIIVLLTLVSAPNAGSANRTGSTYSRAPDGYGAWYAFMEKQGTPVKRLQKPFDEFPALDQNKVTLLRVNSNITERSLSRQEIDWVEQGNRLVILGVRSPVTKAPFTTFQQSTSGIVKIDTGRRHAQLGKIEKQWLGDRFGAIVWQEPLQQGQVIVATTPHLGANAYQDRDGNYKFLADLVTQPNSQDVSQPFHQVWVDEYLHGYKDADVQESEDGEDWQTYLAKTPLFSGLVQVGIILIVLAIAQNRRLGPPLTLTAPIVENSEAYIQALASVLQKADSSEFVLEVVGKEEQLQLQKALGLGSILLDNQTLVAAWVQQTGRPAAELDQLLNLQSKKRRISEQNLQSWLEKWQQVRSYVSKTRKR